VPVRFGPIEFVAVDVTDIAAAGIHPVWRRISGSRGRAGAVQQRSPAGRGFGAIRRVCAIHASPPRRRRRRQQRTVRRRPLAARYPSDKPAPVGAPCKSAQPTLAQTRRFAITIWSR
jgi:hypothetical protein